MTPTKRRATAALTCVVLVLSSCIQIGPPDRDPLSSTAAREALSAVLTDLATTEMADGLLRVSGSCVVRSRDTVRGRAPSAVILESLLGPGLASAIIGQPSSVDALAFDVLENYGRAVVVAVTGDDPSQSGAEVSLVYEDERWKVDC
jgi:hypothetical protein